METGWLLDDGTMCIGVADGRFTFVPYTDKRALRMMGEVDARLLQTALIGVGLRTTANQCKATEHIWG